MLTGLKIRKKQIFVFGAVLAIIIFGFIFLFFNKQKIAINNTQSIIQSQIKNNKKLTSPISGLECANYQKRPIAVILSGDEITRPLSGISQADLIVEMPVMKNGVNRFMAVFVCEEPLEIGSIRSARHDFIPLARGFDAVLAHWGGSYLALNELKKGIIDNIDAIYGESWAFFRKQDISQPHNGFTSFERLKNALEKLDYRQNNKFTGFLHTNKENIASSEPLNAEIIINYPFKVKYVYNQAENNYYRWRNNKAEIDKNNGKQIKSAVIAVLRTNIEQIDDQYNNIDIQAQGRLDLFQNGKHAIGSWSSIYDNSGKLYFLDQNGYEIELMPGQIWIEILDNETEVKY